MIQFKIFTASAYKPANETFDKVANEVAAFVNRCETTPKVEWLQSSQGEYDIRLTAIVTYTITPDAYS